MNISEKMINRTRFLSQFGWAIAGSQFLLGKIKPRKEINGNENSGQFNVKDYGATGTGKELDTKFIQKAIDACARSGGGRVYFPPGTYLSGTLFIKNNIDLNLNLGATLLGSPHLSDYPVTYPDIESYTKNYTNKSLIYADNKKNIAITGSGTIDGQGKMFSGPYKQRPYMLRIINSQNITINNITIRNSPMWVQHYFGCENVKIRGITVHSKVNRNNDGIDIDSCQKVCISDCEIWSGDDAIVLKATSNCKCRDVTITNCVLSTDCNAFKLGTESSGGFENIVLNNCTMYDVGLSGIALEEVDGGVCDRVIVSNVNMVDVNNAIFIRLGDRGRPPGSKRNSSGGFSIPEGIEKPGIGMLRNIIISNIQATVRDTVGCSVTGLPDHPVENITLENVRITFTKGSQLSVSNISEVPEVPEDYPEYTMFGDLLPAYGFYCRHAGNLNFHYISLDFKEKDTRPALVGEDIRGLRIQDFDAEISKDTSAVCWLKEVRAVFITGNRPMQPVPTFIRLEGTQNQRISIQGNDFVSVHNIVNSSVESPDDVIYMEDNRL